MCLALPFPITLLANLKVVSGRSGDAYLTVKEEHELVAFILQCASLGFPVSREDVLAIVQNILDSKGSTRTVSSGWMDGQISAALPTQLTLKNAVQLSRTRGNGISPGWHKKIFRNAGDLLEREWY